MNMQIILNDPELWKEFVKASAIASQYRSQVQFRKDLLTLTENFWGNMIIHNCPTGEILVNAFDGYVNPALSE